MFFIFYTTGKLTYFHLMINNSRFKFFKSLKNLKLPTSFFQHEKLKKKKKNTRKSCRRSLVIVSNTSSDFPVTRAGNDRRARNKRVEL